MGFNATHGLFGMITGTLTLDPANPAAASVSVEIPIASVQTSVPALIENIMKPMLMDAAKYPTATFKSTKVEVSGTTAKITGQLTLHGVTRQVLLDARLVGAGANPNSKKDTVGFEATTSINRFDYGITGVPIVADKVDLDISIAFERN